MIAFGKPDWLQPQSLLIEVFTEQHVLVSSPRLWINGEPPALASSTLLHVQDVALRLPIWSDWLQAWGPADLDLGPGLQLSTLDQAINAAVAGAGIGVVDLSMVRSELQSGALLRHGPEQLSGRTAYWFVGLTKQADQSALVALFALWLKAQAHDHPQTNL
jgi:LysR family glycine cleavage system transcriptional activator